MIVVPPLRTVHGLKIYGKRNSIDNYNLLNKIFPNLRNKTKKVSKGKLNGSQGLMLEVLMIEEGIMGCVFLGFDGSMIIPFFGKDKEEFQDKLINLVKEDDKLINEY